jgi:predicted mannosyl-3-phosphoglycerate phosphatase (HAD superfamily)
VGTVIEGAWRRGARLDSWDEHFDFAKWQAAMEKTGTDLTSIVGREIPLHAAKPWSHIACYRDEDFLRSQYQAMLSALNEEQQR